LDNAVHERSVRASLHSLIRSADSLDADPKGRTRICNHPFITSPCDDIAGLLPGHCDGASSSNDCHQFCIMGKHNADSVIAYSHTTIKMSYCGSQKLHEALTG